jgi:four helix bundle protein
MSQIPKTKIQTPEKRVRANRPQTYEDLEDRMSKFGEDTIIFCRSVKQDSIASPIINQLVRSATSIGANYMEANNASSKKDFRNKVYIAKKEAEETKHWLRMLKAALPSKAEDLRIFWQECHELVLILQAIVNKVDNGNSGK